MVIAFKQMLISYRNWLRMTNAHDDLFSNCGKCFISFTKSSQTTTIMTWYRKVNVGFIHLIESWLTSCDTGLLEIESFPGISIFTLNIQTDTERINVCRHTVWLLSCPRIQNFHNNSTFLLILVIWHNTTEVLEKLRSYVRNKIKNIGSQPFICYRLVKQSGMGSRASSVDTRCQLSIWRHGFGSSDISGTWWPHSGSAQTRVQWSSCDNAYTSARYDDREYLILIILSSIRQLPSVFVTRKWDPLFEIWS